MLRCSFAVLTNLTIAIVIDVPLQHSLQINAAFSGTFASATVRNFKLTPATLCKTNLDYFDASDVNKGTVVLECGKCTVQKHSDNKKLTIKAQKVDGSKADTHLVFNDAAMMTTWEATARQMCCVE
jgi:hypothetical protein